MFYLRSKTDLLIARHCRRALTALALLIPLSLAGCGELEKSKGEPYYAESKPPRKQEFRWSNGKLPRSSDPARASVPPETDLVRAIYEGLTELDPVTLEARPALADEWTASDDNRTWTFHLRPGARWSNGKQVTADDFVRSWKRLGQLGDAAAHHDLLKNIVGFPIRGRETGAPPAGLVPVPAEPSAMPIPAPSIRETPAEPNTDASPVERVAGSEPAGVLAVDASTLRVSLIAPDADFPKLVAHPIFRPIFGDGTEFESTRITPDAVVNGPFKIASVNSDGVMLERSETYWNRDSVKLERVSLVTTENAEAALDAYRSGEIDAITNAEFEPLALKLLEPFEDFRRRTHAAVNFYEINHERPPFDDRRVREALAIAIERERLTEGEMEGLTQPALSFLPFKGGAEARLIQDKERASELLGEAGFPNGENFPVIRLVVNRNDTQQRIARAVARMWKQNLDVETEIIVKENAEVEEARNAGDFDLVRRNTVFPTADELMSILSVLRPPKSDTAPQPVPSGTAANGVEATDAPSSSSVGPAGPSIELPDITMSEANAVYELWAIPLYFPTSYSLVKPYVAGFEMNSLDTPLLQNVSIDSNWQPK